MQGLVCWDACAKEMQSHRPAPVMDSADAREEVSPDSKRARLSDWRQWELSPMRRLREAGDGIDIQTEEDHDWPTFRAQVQGFVDGVKNTHDEWQQYSDQVKDAVIILEYANHAISSDWKSLLFKTKLVTAILLSEVRAHESGGYERVQGVWVQMGDGWGSRQLERLETATKVAMGMLVDKCDELNAVAAGEGRSAIIAATATAFGSAEQMEALIMRADKKPDVGAPGLLGELNHLQLALTVADLEQGGEVDVRPLLPVGLHTSPAPEWAGGLL